MAIPPCHLPPFLPGTFWGSRSDEEQSTWWKYTSEAEETFFMGALTKVQSSDVYAVQLLHIRAPRSTDETHAFLWVWDAHGLPVVDFSVHLALKPMNTLEKLQFIRSYPACSQHHALLAIDCYERNIALIEATADVNGDLLNGV